MSAQDSELRNTRAVTTRVCLAAPAEPFVTSGPPRQSGNPSYKPSLGRLPQSAPTQAPATASSLITNQSLGPN